MAASRDLEIFSCPGLVSPLALEFLVSHERAMEPRIYHFQATAPEWDYIYERHVYYSLSLREDSREAVNEIANRSKELVMLRGSLGASQEIPPSAAQGIQDPINQPLPRNERLMNGAC